MKPHRSLILAVAVFSWAMLAGAGFVWLGRYEHQPGRAVAAPEVWPAESGVELDGDKPTLVMFAHPRCPCTRASLEELAKVMAQSAGRARAVVLFFKPKAGGEEWSQTDLCRQAAAIPGVAIQPDVEGAEAQRFHSETSGQVFLYDSRGHLLFAGGITDSRGHEGDNMGRSAVVAILKDGALKQSGTPVFGCSLLNPDTVCRATN